MKVAIMQPYLFPYVGYFQLVACVDVFVLFDDVNYRSRSYINRNMIMERGKARRITFPVLGASINKKICDLEFVEDQSRELERIRHAYARSPNFSTIFPLVQSVLQYKDRCIPAICAQAIESIFRYLGRRCDIMLSSSLAYNRQLPATDKIIAICHELGAEDYINSPGGKRLYNKSYFESCGCSLRFLEPLDISCFLDRAPSAPNLSIIDALMWCDKDKVNEALSAYELS